MTESKDAKVVLEDGEAKVIPEETGTKLDTAKLYDKVINALKIMILHWMWKPKSVIFQHIFWRIRSPF